MRCLSTISNAVFLFTAFNYPIDDFHITKDIFGAAAIQMANLNSKRGIDQGGGGAGGLIDFADLRTNIFIETDKDPVDEGRFDAHL